MASSLKNVIVVGGSFVGRTTAQEIARVIPTTHRVLLIEPHTHFHHLFTFPRFAIVPGHEHKAFIPYSGLFAAVPNPTAHSVVTARVVSVHENKTLTLDREWQGSRQISFEYLALATGTRLAEPAGMKDDDKASSVAYLQRHQADIKNAKSILIAGGGAVGVQMATDLAEYYPDKEITVVQSRPHLMPQFHKQFHEFVSKRFQDLGVKLVTGARLVVPPEGFPKSGPFDVQLTNGTSVSTDFVVLATGQTPNTGLIQSLPGGAELINPANGFIRIKPTLQVADDRYPEIFAVGDVADTGARKAARPGAGQAAVVARNIQALIEGRAADAETEKPGAAGIHITLGLVSPLILFWKYNIVFRNPDPAAGQTEPMIRERHDGSLDMNVEGMWDRMNVKPDEEAKYHL
ncbi:hypothetical protein ASPZODRAFT_103576 [Penicilliopsis zonata CBS 506.65]|uniref:FAD/NAD(P)-binding domain-containing protein n=1 Tax=Penicilliopsis zonata CBS 506.65 TaxID=1073090 RepID=A0A1L9S7Q7_9EURO|nr:hypothetical protein ASPZODRAFT_103576 [Penicilliopsis zonata CBS 506.65]OJJ43197.1 hypothetical protein ASPZODRAFT_103576 [Penicilliopsis zonata CBS 506.65]